MSVNFKYDCYNTDHSISGVKCVLVVSNIDLTTNLPTMKPSKFLESSIKDFTLNINNDYRYLKTGYYVSLHAEILDNAVIPKSENILDAHRTPILLLRASKAGIPTFPYLVTSSVKQIISEIGFPVVVFAVNPFSYDGFKIAKNRSALYRAMKSLGMNYKFDICAQPFKSEIISFKSIFGKCELEGDVERISKKVYDVFKIPLCKLHVQLLKEKAYLCGLQPLENAELSPRDLQVLSEEISQLSKNGELLVG
ncbi:RimK-like ATPgrasp N-terminal domain-containing protein [Candidatus Bathyarchaeota archaeon]|nr:RimK-like ATPgrasp N-terminal domain-containing protein [Candidatus Bathyarchaeota archaeon]